MKKLSILDTLSDRFGYAVSESCRPAFDLGFAPHGLGVIVGPSGSGKTTLLRKIGSPVNPHWVDGRPIAEHFESADAAQSALSAVGLSSVPAWFRPYSDLSTGEQARADMSRLLFAGAVIDEFTSVVDRDTAKSMCIALRRFMSASPAMTLTLATCHRDVLDWLEADWVFDTADGAAQARGWVRRPQFGFEVLPCSREAWTHFCGHHYITEEINKSARCWLVRHDGEFAGFTSIISRPSGYIKGAWGEHRTVVLPEYQGRGLGVRVSEAIGEIVLSAGGRFFSKTAHPRMGEYREAKPWWRPTSKNKVARKEHWKKGEGVSVGWLPSTKLSYSHEYMGGAFADDWAYPCGVTL